MKYPKAKQDDKDNLVYDKNGKLVGVPDTD